MVVNSLWHSYALEHGLILFPITKICSKINSRSSCLDFVVEGSRSQSLGITWEHGGLADIVKAQVQHADSLQAWVGQQYFLENPDASPKYRLLSS